MKKDCEPYGQEVILDLYGCDPEIIRSSKALRIFVDQMCKLLKMKKFGKTMTPHFGHGCPKTSGYSMLQFIETSAITGHFSDARNSCYINIFSCDLFDAKKAMNFTKKYFKASKVTARTLLRK